MDPDPAKCSGFGWIRIRNARNNLKNSLTLNIATSCGLFGSWNVSMKTAGSALGTLKYQIYSYMHMSYLQKTQSGSNFFLFHNTTKLVHQFHAWIKPDFFSLFTWNSWFSFLLNWFAQKSSVIGGLDLERTRSNWLP